MLFDRSISKADSETSKYQAEEEADAAGEAQD